MKNALFSLVCVLFVSFFSGCTKKYTEKEWVEKTKNDRVTKVEEEKAELLQKVLVFASENAVLNKGLAKSDVRDLENSLNNTLRGGFEEIKRILPKLEEKEDELNTKLIEIKEIVDSLIEETKDLSDKTTSLEKDKRKFQEMVEKELEETKAKKVSTLFEMKKQEEKSNFQEGLGLALINPYGVKYDNYVYSWGWGYGYYGYGGGRRIYHYSGIRPYSLNERKIIAEKLRNHQERSNDHLLAIQEIEIKFDQKIELLESLLL